MATKYHQISLKGSFPDYQDFLITTPPSFFDILNGHIDINEFIPVAFYKTLGRKQVE